jgi:hypothetical protein
LKTWASCNFASNIYLIAKYAPKFIMN